MRAGSCALRFHWHQPNRWPIFFIYLSNMSIYVSTEQKIAFIGINFAGTTNLPANLSNIRWFGIRWFCTTECRSYQTHQDLLFIFLIKNIEKHEGLTDYKMFRSSIYSRQVGILPLNYVKTYKTATLIPKSKD